MLLKKNQLQQYGYVSLIYQMNVFLKILGLCCGISKLGLCYIQLEKAMAPHSSALAWKVPWTEEPGNQRSVGLLRVGNDRATSLSPSCIILSLCKREGQDET